MERSISRPRWRVPHLVQLCPLSLLRRSALRRLDPRQSVTTNAVYRHLSQIGVVNPVRRLVVGPSSGPQEPFPLRMEGKVIKGFGRGSKDLGIPTANLPVDDTQTPWIFSIDSGAYFGWASLRLPPAEGSDLAATEFSIYPMVMSIGYNPFYGNTVRSAEVHVLHDFAGRDFYGVEMRLLIVGFIRPERNYPGMQDLIDDIKMDCDVARRSLKRQAWSLRETGKGRLDGSWLVRGVEVAR
ncbi:Riboflavin kinase [Mycena kentingensis (nom. inval.)]|nr:Riboflavin kinase [Mycena kentingensis (nom. inval.)]